MSDENTNPFPDPSEMMRQWFQMASQSAEACQNWTANQVTAETLRQARTNVFNMWSDYWDKLLRSSSFLGAEKQYMAGNNEYRKKMHEFLGLLHHELQLATAPDIDQLMRTLRRMSEDQQEQFEEICERLEDIEARLDELTEQPDSAVQNSEPENNSPSENNSHSNSPSRKRRRFRSRNAYRRQ